MEVVDGKNVHNFFYRVCWYHKILKKRYSGSWQKFDINKNNNEWINQQNKKYIDCYYWLEGVILKDGENYNDIADSKNLLFKNIECFDIKCSTVKIIDNSHNKVDIFMCV